MGNSNGKKSGSKSGSKRGNESSEKSIEERIRAGRLAPKTMAQGDDGAECPICFNSYIDLNGMACCGQDICTDCFVTLRASKSETACPFCAVATFDVKYIVKAKTIKQPEGTKPSPDSPPTPAVSAAVVTTSVADREELEAQIRKQHREHTSELDYFPRPQVSSSSQRYQSRYAVRPRDRGSGEPNNEGSLSLASYLSFFEDMRGLRPAASGGSGEMFPERSRGSSGADSESIPTASAAEAPECEDCGEPTEMSSYAEQGYANGLYICNICQRTLQCADERWLCRMCTNDYCFRCRPRGSNLDRDHSHRNSGHLQTGPGGRMHQRYYASRSSQQNATTNFFRGLMMAPQPPSAQESGGMRDSGVSLGSDGASVEDHEEIGTHGGEAPTFASSLQEQWNQESDLLEEMMLLEAIQLSLAESSGDGKDATVQADSSPQGSGLSSESDTVQPQNNQNPHNNSSTPPVERDSEGTTGTATGGSGGSSNSIQSDALAPSPAGAVMLESPNDDLVRKATSIGENEGHDGIDPGGPSEAVK